MFKNNIYNTCITEAKKLVAEGKEKEAGIPLLRAYRGLPKNSALDQIFK